MATRNGPDPPRPRELPDDRPHKRAHPLFWLLILVALFALGWSFYNHHAGESMPAPIRPDASPAPVPSGPPAPGQTNAPTPPGND
jgi:hypothetical protein